MRFLKETLCTLTFAFGLAAAPPVAHYVRGNFSAAPPPDGFVPESIMVFTGSSDRVAQGFNLHLASVSSKLMITGKDYARDALEPDISALSLLAANRDVTIDLEAKTTIENARNGAQWAAENNVRSILLVTSDNHMDRAYFELRRLLPRTVSLYAGSIPSIETRDGLNSERNMLACRVYESFYGLRFCNRTRRLARELGI